MFEDDNFKVDYQEIALPNGVKATVDQCGYALESIGHDLYCEWYKGERVAIVDKTMANLPAPLEKKIIERLNHDKQVRV